MIWLRMIRVELCAKEILIKSVRPEPDRRESLWDVEGLVIQVNKLERASTGLS